MTLGNGSHVASGTSPVTGAITEDATEPVLCIDAPRASEGAEERTLAFTMMPGAVRAETVTVACATGGTGDANCQRDTLPATQTDGPFFLSSETSPLEVGMERFVATDKGDFIGRAGYLVRQQAGPTHRFSVLDIEPGDSDATGEEGVYHGNDLVGAVTSGGYSHILDRLLVHTCLPVEIASPGTDLTVSVLMERRPAKVIAESPFDPENRRPRGV